MVQIVRNKKDVTLYISLYNLFDINFLYEILSSNTNIYNKYTILLRVSYKKKDMNFTEYKMLGDQIHFSYKSVDYLVNQVNDFSNVVIDRFKYIAELYDIKYSEVLNIQIIIYKEVYDELVVKKSKFSVGSLGENKDLINVSKVSEGLNKLLPLSINSNDFGVELETIKDDKFIKEVILANKTKVNLVDCINKYSRVKLDSFSENVKFYQKDIDGITYIITSYLRDDLITKDINVYNINGMKIHSMEDKVLSDNKFKRKIGNISVFINEKGIYNKVITHNFDPIKPQKLTGEQTRMIHPD